MEYKPFNLEGRSCEKAVNGKNRKMNKNLKKDIGSPLLKLLGKFR
jgi:hypothetical protein